MLTSKNKADFIHTQIESITRYFKSYFTQEDMRGKLFKMVNKINHPTKLANISDEQFNITMHHLFSLERRMSVYFTAILTVERELARKLLQVEVKENSAPYERYTNPIESHKQAEEILNLDKLFSWEV